MSKNAEIAKRIADTCKKLGWEFVVRNNILTICKSFTPGSRDEFVQADTEYYSILSQLPQSRPGSIWGTDGGGVGGMVAMKDGFFVMHKSGGNRHVLKQLGAYNGNS